MTEFPWAVAFFFFLVSALALALAIGSVFLSAKQVLSEKTPLPRWLFGVCVACLAAWPLISFRRISGYRVEIEADPGQLGLGVLVFRSFNFLVVCVLAIALVRFMFVVRRIHGATSRSLLVGVLLFYLASNYLINNFLSSHSQLSMQPFYAAAFILVFPLMHEGDLASFVSFARNVLVAFCMVGMLLIPVLPDMVLQTSYDQGAFPLRFWGLASHANTMGPLLVVSIILTSSHRYMNRWINATVMFILMFGLVATQSKTSFLALVICFLTKYVWSHFNSGQVDRSQFSAAFSGRAAAISTMLVVLILLVDFVLFVGSMDSIGASGGHARSEILSLTNRDIIWQAAFDEFLRNPWFGYGSSIFDEVFRYRIRIPSAANAHNQVMHTISMAGILGLWGLIIYVWTLGYFAFKKAAIDNGVAVMLFVLMLVRSITEIPFSIHSPTSIEVFIQVLLMAVLVSGLHDHVRFSVVK